MSVFALILNLLIVGCEICTLKNIKKKSDILKYYTYLQNLIALIVSLIFSLIIIVSIFSGEAIPEFFRGLRYIATSGLAATTLIYGLFLSKDKNLMTERDFNSGFSPKAANFILHYFCPSVSIFSFLIFEREIILTNEIWTGLVAIPSCGYWVIYLFLTVTKLWEEPYNFKSSGGKHGNIAEIFSMFFIPAAFIAISIILWNIK